MASDPKKLQAHLARVAPDLPLVFKPMFGGILAYADGKPVASLSDRGLALKLSSPALQEELLTMKGATRLIYEPGQPPSKTYIVVPPSLLKDRAALHTWLLKSVDCNKASPKRPTKRR